MVFRNPFRCDICGIVFNLKIQADNSLSVYNDYPISLTCPECGNVLELSYSRSKGILPRDYKAEENVEPKYDLYYSAFLPIPKDMHLRPSKQIGLTPFMTLSKYYPSEEVEDIDTKCNLFLENIYPYRSVFKDLLPIYRKGNTTAYSKKLVKVLEIDGQYTPIDDIKVCRQNLLELFQNTYNNLAPEKYIKDIAFPLFDGILNIQRIDDLKEAYQIASQVINYNPWQMKAFDYIGKIVSKFEKYMPSLFYLTVGDFQERHKLATNIYTIGAKEAINDYDESFNLIKEMLPLLISLTNFRITGDALLFPNKAGGMKGVNGVKGFYNLPDGLKLDKLSDYPEIMHYLQGGFNSKIRNGIGHSRWNIVEGTQLIQFYYKQNNDIEHYDAQLVDICYLTIINFLHIVEFVLIVENLKR